MEVFIGPDGAQKGRKKGKGGKGKEIGEGKKRRRERKVTTEKKEDEGKKSFFEKLPSQ